MSSLKDLKELLHVATHGDEDGFQPDLTIAELEALKWAVETIDQQEKEIKRLNQELLTHSHVMYDADNKIEELNNTVSLLRELYKNNFDEVERLTKALEEIAYEDGQGLAYYKNVAKEALEHSE